MATPKPWDRPKPLPKGDDDAGAIYSAVGIATSAWEMLQGRMIHLFCGLVGNDSLSLQRAFGTLESVPAKMRMIKAAAEVSLANHPEFAQRLRSTLTEVENFSLRRNDIAHGEVSKFHDNGVDTGYYLIPGSHITEKTNVIKKAGVGFSWWDYKLTAEQINVFTQNFYRMTRDVMSLARDVRELLDPAPAASPEKQP